MRGAAASCHPQYKAVTKAGLCSTCYQRDLWERYPEKREAALKQRRDRAKNNPGIRRNTALKTLYGIGIAEYNQMYEQQGGACAICEETSDGNLFVDHDHDTGAVRSLLCQKCNLGLGHFKDSPELLSKAYTYLKGYK